MISIEMMLRHFGQIRHFYADALKNQNGFEDLSLNEVEILILLFNSPGINTGRDICLILGVSKGLVSRSVESLRQKGLITVSMDEEDRRIGRIALSEKAKTRIVGLKEEIQKMDEGLFSELDEKRILEMEETMEMIVSRLKGVKK